MPRHVEIYGAITGHNYPNLTIKLDEALNFSLQFAVHVAVGLAFSVSLIGPRRNIIIAACMIVQYSGSPVFESEKGAARCRRVTTAVDLLTNHTAAQVTTLSLLYFYPGLDCRIREYAPFPEKPKCSVSNLHISCVRMPGARNER